jgi:hypothetical protein
MNNQIKRQAALLSAVNKANNATLNRFDTTLDKQLKSIEANRTYLFNYKNGAPNKFTVIELFENATRLFEAQVVPTVGFNRRAATNTSDAITVPAN